MRRPFVSGPIGGPIGIVAFVLIVMFIGVGLLYAYRAQSPAVPNAFGLLPVAVLIALILLAAYAFARARVPDPYERLARLADLRDRAVLTEEEFQREKRKILG